MGRTRVEELAPSGAAGRRERGSADGPAEGGLASGKTGHPKRDRERWTAETKLAFKVLDPAALALVATDGPVSVTLWGPGGVAKRFGHNRGVWPAKVAKTTAWKDTVSTTYDKNPFFWMGSQFRVWLPTVADRDRLAASVVDLIAARAEADGGLDALDHGFQDLGADLDLALFEMEVMAVADRLGLTAWDDDGLTAFLSRVLDRAGELKRRSMSRMGDEYAIEVAAMKELGR